MERAGYSRPVVSKDATHGTRGRRRHVVALTTFCRQRDGAARPQECPEALRVISATHRDLPAYIAEGKFREDLYYRLAVLPIRLPSLRERLDDIMLLASHFLERAASAAGKELEGFDEEAATWLLHHRWPGNVRELENVVERAVTLARGPRITLADMHIEFAASARAGGGLRPTLGELAAAASG